MIIQSNGKKHELAYKSFIAAIMISIDVIRKIAVKKVLKNTTMDTIVVFSGGLGDSVMFLPIAHKLISTDEKILFILRNEVYELYKTQGIDASTLMGIDFKRFCIDYKYYKNLSDRLNELSSTKVLIPMCSPTADYVTASIKSNRRFTIHFNKQYGDDLIRRWIHNGAYTDIFNVDNNFSMLKSFYFLFSAVYNVNIEEDAPIIYTNKKMMNKNNTCLITPYSSSSIKDWEDEKYEEIIRRLSMNGFNIIICVVEQQKHRVCEMIKNVKSENVELKITPSIEELIQLIDSAKYIIGADSGPIHMAAALGVPAICILSGESDYYVYPYQVEKSDKIINAVKTEEKKCFGCMFKKGKHGYGNVKCMERINHGMNAACVSEISVERVWAKFLEISQNK